MFNFMQCNGFIMDREDKLCVTFKASQPGIKIYIRKYDHGFHETIDNISREGCCGMNIKTKEMFLITDDSHILKHSAKTFKVEQEIPLPLTISTTSDDIEILSIQMSSDEKYIAVLAGKNLIKEIEEIHELLVYDISSENMEFKLVQKIELPSEFKFISRNFYFYNNCDKMQELLFVDKAKIMKYNYMTQTCVTLYQFKNQLGRQPDFVEFDKSQNYVIIASVDDVLWVCLQG